MSNNNYPLDEKALEEQYADLLLKIALKEYLKEQALQMKQQEAEAAPAPQPTQESSNVVAVAFRQVGWQETKETLLHGLKKGVTRVAVVFLAGRPYRYHSLCPLPGGKEGKHSGEGDKHDPQLCRYAYQHLHHGGSAPLPLRGVFLHRGAE